MAATQLSVKDLADRGEFKALEDRWLSVIDPPCEPREDLLAALEIVTKRGKGELAAALGWTWLTIQRERSGPEEVLALGRDLMLCCGDSEEMRKEILGLYEEVFADRPEIARLIEASGLTGDKSPRRALRTLEICLGLKVGDLLLGRSEEKAAEVVDIDLDNTEYTLRTRSGEETLDPDTLGLRYDPVGPNDFRALAQLHPERIAELVKSDPAALIIGVLHSHHNRLDSEELQHILSPRHIPADKWGTWWSRAKTQLKRCPNVILEGRNPIILTWHEEEKTLEHEIEPQWEAADTPAKRLAAVETYLREARGRRSELQPEMIQQMHKDLLMRVNTTRKGSPAHALTEALIIDRLLDDAGAAGVGLAAPARQILTESRDLAALLGGLEDSKLYLRALRHVREMHPEDWPEVYLRILPLATVDGCEAIAAALIEAGHRDRLRPVCEQILSDFTKHLDAVCWLWRTRLDPDFEPLAARDLLIRLLEFLGQVTRDELAPPDVVRNARTKIRAALSSGKYQRYRQVIEEMEPGLASTIRTTVDRLDGLGHVVQANLMKLVVEVHPEVGAIRAKAVEPWFDDGIIFCTQKGLDKRREEIDHLVRVKIPENARAIGEAASHGDLSENSEYKFALEERDLLQARLAKMQNEMALARLVTANDVTAGAVEVGTRVTLQSTDGTTRREITILGPFETDVERSVYNYKAPLCTRLKGLVVGDTVRLDLDGGEKEYRIEVIANALDR